MTTFPDMLKLARRRWLIDQALRYAGWGLFGGLILALGLLGLDRFTRIDVPSAAMFVAAGVGLLAGLAIAYSLQPRAIDVAVHLDRALKLKDRIGTATAIDDRHPGV